MATSILFNFEKSNLGNIKYDIWFQKCGYEKCMPNKSAEGKDKIYFSLHYIISGSGNIQTTSEVKQLKAGDMFLVYPEGDSIYYPSSSNSWSYIWIDFCGENLEHLFGKCGFTRQTPYLEDRQKLRFLFNQIFNTFNMSKNTYFQSSAIFMQILSVLESKEKYNERDDKFTPEVLVREAVIFINCNYKINISVADIAHNVGVSVSYLIGIFAKYLGLSPIKYLTIYRIANACEIFQKNGKTKNISEVSYEVGFNDPKYFARCFVKIKGVTASEYIKTNNDNPWKFLTDLNINYR